MKGSFLIMFHSFLLGWWLGIMAFDGFTWWRVIGAGLALALLINHWVELRKFKDFQ